MRAIVIASPPRGAAWATLLALGLAYEFHELRDGDEGFPLTHAIRKVFRTDTPVGRAAFVITVRRGSDWLIDHVLQPYTNNNHHEGIHP